MWPGVEPVEGQYNHTYLQVPLHEPLRFTLDYMLRDDRKKVGSGDSYWKSLAKKPCKLQDLKDDLFRYIGYPEVEGDIIIDRIHVSSCIIPQTQDQFGFHPCFVFGSNGLVTRCFDSWWMTCTAMAFGPLWTSIRWGPMGVMESHGPIAGGFQLGKWTPVRV